MAQREPLKILVFSVSIGTGHDMAARAIAECLFAVEPGVEVKIVDTFRYCNRLLNKVVVESYLETLRFTPKVWGYLYDQAEQGERLAEVSRLLVKIIAPKLAQLITEFDPDVIITTHAFPTDILGKMKNKGLVKKLLVSVVTDFHIHPIWINKGIDLYFVHSPDLGQVLCQAGIPPEKIKSWGIPLRKQFTDLPRATYLRKRFSFLGSPVVLVMGGGLGLGKIKMITKGLLQEESFGVVVVTGRNLRLYRTLKKWDNPRLRVYGYVQNMAKVISSCDLIVSKPGGVTSAEVLALGKPLIIYASLPGQEDRNTAYLLAKGVALRVQELKTLVAEIRALWENPARLAQMRQKAKQLGAPQASLHIWENIYLHFIS